MKTKERTLIFLRKRKVMVFMPVIVVPFLTLFFLALGGGQVSTVNAQSIEHKGLIKTLPDANVDQKTILDKLNYYEHAAADSAKVRELLKQDPYFERNGKQTVFEEKNVGTMGSGAYNEPNEQQIYQKLEQLNSVLNAKSDPKAKKIPSETLEKSVNSDEVYQLQKMMTLMKDNGNQDDPEMKQLQTMLDRIQEIQHPELLKEKKQVNKVKEPNSAYKTIPAEISKTQKVTYGTVIELRLLDSITLNGNLIPKGHKLFGSCEISNQRLVLRIKNIRIGYSIIPVDLTVFDEDGMEGINVPEAITQEALRGGSNDAFQNLQLLTMDQGVGTQIAGAGISAAKGLFGKKVKPVKAKIKAGYKVLLRNNQQIINF